MQPDLQSFCCRIISVISNVLRFGGFICWKIRDSSPARLLRLDHDSVISRRCRCTRCNDLAQLQSAQQPQSALFRSKNRARSAARSCPLSKAMRLCRQESRLSGKLPSRDDCIQALPALGKAADLGIPWNTHRHAPPRAHGRSIPP